MPISCLVVTISWKNTTPIMRAIIPVDIANMFAPTAKLEFNFIEYIQLMLAIT